MREAATTIMVKPSAVTLASQGLPVQEQDERIAAYWPDLDRFI